MQLNKVFFAGYLGHDAKEIKTNNGTRLVTFSLCYTKRGKEGRADQSVWVNCKVFGGWCDMACLLKKGDNVIVDGEVQVNTFVGKDGKERQSIDIFPFSLGLISKATAEKNSPAEAPQQSSPLEDLPF